MKKANITIINVVSTVILQLVTILSGFVIPKLIIANFGSEVNGLVSSLNQFLSYITLLEGGITAVILSNLYKPLIDNDTKKISSIIKTSNYFYKKIGIIYIIYTFIIAIFFSHFYNLSKFSSLYVFSLTLILSISLLIQYMLSLSFRNLLNADKKVYIVSLTQTLILILNIILGYMSIKIYPSIHLFKVMTGLTFIIQPLVFGIYIKKNYNISKNVSLDSSLTKDRWSGFFNNFAYFIHSSTDITILTLFTNLLTVSIYSVYSLVTTGLKSLINAVSNGIYPAIGHTYAKADKKKLLVKFNIYENIAIILTFLLFSVACLLITPFVILYTKNISDANYYQPVFGVLLIISTMLDLLKIPHLNLAYTAGKFKKMMIPSFIEALINITVSLLFVFKYGLLGVTIGTIVAMLSRLCYQVYLTKKIIGRSQIRYYYKIFVLAFLSIIFIVTANLILPFKEYTVRNFIIYGFIYFVVFSCLYLFIYFIFFTKDFKQIYNHIMQIKENRKVKEQ